MVQPGDTLLGRYRVLSPLGRGGMADVFLALDEERQVRVAIKVLRADLAEEPEFVRRFAREAEALAKLEHPHIARSYSFESAGTLAFIVLEYASGGTLRTRLREANGPLPLAEVALLLRQIATALHYAHRRGFVHRDIKPANIMYREDGTALLTDFGIAKAVETATLTMAEIGTPAYMSPEQVLGQPLDGRSDIYSLGIVLYEAIAGVRPFSGKHGAGPTTPRRVQDEHVHLPPPDPRSLQPSLPAAAAAVIMRALAKRPADRWPDAIDMADAWDAAIAPQLAPAAATSPRRQPPRRGRRGLALGVATCAVLGLISGGTYAAYRRFYALPNKRDGTATTATNTPDGAIWRAPTPAPTTTTVATGPEAQPYEDAWGAIRIHRGSAILLGVTIGVGAAEAVGEAIANAAAIALADHGPVSGFSVALAREDDDGSGQRGIEIAERFCASPNVAAVIGHACSTSTAAALPIYEQKHGLLVSPSSSWAEMTTAGSLSFDRVCRNDSAYAFAMARFLHDELALGRLAIAHDRTEGSPGFASELARAWTDAGGTVVYEADMGEGLNHAAAVLQSALDSGAQAFCCAGAAERVAVYARSRIEIGAEGLVLAASHIAAGPALLEAAGRAADGVYVAEAVPAGDLDALAAFANVYSRRFGPAPNVESLSAYAYDATMLVLRAADRVAQPDADRNLLLGRRALALALRHTDGHPGLTGVLTCDSHGDCGRARVRVLRVVAGEFAPVWTSDV